MVSIRKKKGDHTMKQTISTALLCNPAAIPAEYEKAAYSLAARYVTDNSLSGLYKIDFDIVYNHVCNLVLKNLENNPEFSADNFSQFIKSENLFYGMAGIQAVIAEYKKDPDAAFPYILCFFSRKLCSFRKNNIAYTKGLDPEEVDSVLVIALYKVLDAYNFSMPFSFDYLTLELRSALTELCGQMHPFGMNRNDLMAYRKLSYLIDKYSLTSESLPLFLTELNSTLEDLPQCARRFRIDDADMRYSCKISLKKANAFFSLYSIENMGFITDIAVPDDPETLFDKLCTTFENGYSDVELELFAAQTLTDENEKRIFNRLTQPEGDVFTNRELADEYEFTRYALAKLKKRICREIL